MTRATIGRLVMAAAVLLGLALVAPSGNAQTPQQERSQVRQQIYGRQLMTRAEIQAYRAKMRSLKTEQERRAFREEHHRRMQERARERGIKLPEMPPAGHGPGAPGRGPGMSDGGGRGPRR